MAAELAARVHRLTEWGYPARLIDAAEAVALEPALRLPGPRRSRRVVPGRGLPADRAADRAPGRQRDGPRRHRPDRRPGPRDRPGPQDPGRVRTAAGEVLAADEIVCCAGRWTPQLAALAGPACPVPLVAWDTPGSPAPALIVRVGPVGPEGPVRLIHTPQLALRPHSGGLLHLEAPDAAVDLHTPDAELRRWAAELLHRARRTVRGLQDAAVAGYQVCVRPLPADGSPSSAACPAPSGSTSR